jgi:hypothetical protein
VLDAFLSVVSSSEVAMWTSGASRIQPIGHCLDMMHGETIPSGPIDKMLPAQFCRVRLSLSFLSSAECPKAITADVLDSEVVEEF